MEEVADRNLVRMGVPGVQIDDEGQHMDCMDVVARMVVVRMAVVAVVLNKRTIKQSIYFCVLNSFQPHL